ncbi:MAG TPA: ABC transporter substrate-binding protein [Candidatus Eisenbacteria bacterium]|nr:ABC transporter substrate-binding protein [Candidatus Eisenbacteria bacterium]
MLTRRRLLIGVAAGLGAWPFLQGRGLGQIKGRLGYMKIVDNAAMFMAAEKGFFKAEGLELEPVPMAGGAVIVQGVTSGDLQIGWTNVISLYQAHVEGFDFRIISGGATNVKAPKESHAILVGKNSPITRARDLEGKTVAVNTLNNIVHLMAMAWLDKHGADSSRVKFVELPFPQMGAALETGRVDAVSIHEPFATAAQDKGNARVLAYPWGEVIPKFLIASWFASQKWIEKNRGAVEGFVRAISRGTDLIRSDPAAARAAMIKWAGLSPDLAGKIGLPAFEKGVAEKDLQVTIDLTYKYKMIPRSFKAREVISELAPRA